MNSLAKSIAAMSIIFAGGAQAAPQIFFGEDIGIGEGSPLATFPNASSAEAAFLSNLTGAGTESFESFGTGTGGPLTVSFGTAGDATLSGNGNVSTVAPGTTNGVGRYAISGSNFWEVTGVFTITFTNPIVAFGFYGVDIGDFNGQITLTLTNGGVTDLTVPNGLNISGGSVLYYGIIDTENPFTSISFDNTASGTDFFAFDDFTIGTAEQVVEEPSSVPEPVSLALLGIGLAGLGASRRLRAA